MLSRAEFEQITAALDAQLAHLASMRAEAKNQLSAARLSVKNFEQSIRQSDRLMKQTERLKAGLVKRYG